MKKKSVKNLQDLILNWLESRLISESFRKIESTFDKLKRNAEDWEVFSSFSAVPRYTGKNPLNLAVDEYKAADRLRNGWDPRLWTIDQLGRTLMILAISGRDKEEFLDKLDKLFISSDMGEAVALYQTLPVLPFPEDLQERAAEGIRSNITSVFNAVALRNPYPADFLEKDAWNQMVLKALFVGSPLHLIQGIDARANATLARMLVEYAHERWSAGRVVSPELWRPVGPFIDHTTIGDIEQLINRDEQIHRQAAILALSASESESAESLLAEHDNLLQEMQKKENPWADIGKRFHEDN